MSREALSPFPRRPRVFSATAQRARRQPVKSTRTQTRGAGSWAAPGGDLQGLADIRYRRGMLTLSLLRHAKSSWDDPGLEDIHRPLAERGRKAAPRMGAYMAEHGIAPELVLCSPSVRTRLTLDLVLPALEAKPKVVYEDGLYLASAPTLLKRIRKVKGNVRHVMVVGHDPGLHNLAVELVGSGNPADLQALAAKFPTAGLAVIAFQVSDWTAVEAGAGRLVLFMTPRRLP
jgi:phosphohistidine phosphatase